MKFSFALSTPSAKSRPCLQDFDHPSESLAPPDFPIRDSNFQCRLDNSGTESVMVSLTVIILEILVDHMSQMIFASDGAIYDLTSQRIPVVSWREPD